MRLFNSAGRTGLGLCILAACTGEATGPDRSEAGAITAQNVSAAATPHFLQLAPNAPPLVSPTVSFWAVNGEDREGEIFYKRRNGPPTNSDRLLRFRVDKRSLVKRPDGTPIAPGDSILITITVVDPQHQIVEFKPSGLQFAPNRPADLTLWYYKTNHDFNGDGIINGADTALEKTFKVWRQHTTSAPWAKQPTQLTIADDEAEIDVAGFTRFAVAY